MSTSSATLLPRQSSSAGLGGSFATSGAMKASTASRQWLLRRQYQRDFFQRLEDDSEEAMLAAEDADLLTWGDKERYDNNSDDGDDGADDDDGGSPSPANQSGGSPRSMHQVNGVLPSAAAAKSQANTKKQALREALLQRTIPLRFMLEYLQKRRSATKATIDLLLFLPLLFLSLNLFVFRAADVMESGAHWSAALTANLVNAPVTPQGFHPSASPLSVEGPHYQLDFRSIRTASEWILWLQRVVVPFLYNPLNRTTSPSRPGPPVGQTVLASAIRLRTLRVRNNTCSVPTHLVSGSAQSVFGDVPCYAAMEEDALDSSQFEINTTRSSGGGSGGMQPLTYEDFNECGGFSSTLLQTRAEYRGGYGCGGYMLFLNGSLTFSDALDLTDAWAASGVLHNAATRFVSLDLILYHTALDAFVLLELSQEVAEGGSWHAYPRLSLFQVLSADTNSYSPSERTSDAFLAIFLIVGWLVFFGEWAASFRHNRRSVCAYFVDPWTIVNATYLTCVSVALVLTWVQAVAGNDAFGSSAEKPPVLSSQYSYRLVRLARLYHWTRYFNSIAAVLLLLRVMEYFRLNSRLNILTRTLGRVAESIFGLVVVFCFFVVAFALCGHVLYGSALFSYSTMALSFSTSMLSLMGSFDYSAMRRYDQPLTFVYFWSFIVLGLFVLLNFMTAVISTSFDNERTHLRLIPLRVVLRRWRRYLTTVRPLQETLHLYVRCVKAFHSVSPNVLWNRFVQHVETSIALDELLQHEQHVQRRAEMQRRNTTQVVLSPPPSADLFRGTPSGDARRSTSSSSSGSSSFSDAQRAHNHRSELLDQLVGVPFLVGAIGKEDVSVITMPHVESIFLAMLRAHDRLRPMASVSDHWKQLDLVETVALERVITFLTSTTIAGRVERKAKRVVGKEPLKEDETIPPNEPLTKRSTPSELVAAIAARKQGSGDHEVWVKLVLLPVVFHHRGATAAPSTGDAFRALSSAAPPSMAALHHRIENITTLLSTLQ
jgi:hypothetical protein